MNREETLKMQSDYASRMVKNLPVLRAATGLTQAQLADKIGVGRQTIVSIETNKRPLSWSLYLAMICLFQQCKESNLLLKSLKIFSSSFIINGLER